MPKQLTIDRNRFNDESQIVKRVAKIPAQTQGSLRTALRFLYLDNGPIGIPPDRRKSAEPYLDEAERIIIRWLATRTNGNLRKHYGREALIAARSSRYRCNECGFSDVRTLNLDHVDGRIVGTTFACLCANCHAIKSREVDWTGKRRVLRSTPKVAVVCKVKVKG